LQGETGYTASHAVFKHEGTKPHWPPVDVIEQCHAGGLKVGALAGAPKHALSHVANGVDIIIAQGYEAGGHTGEIASMVLTPDIVDAVGPDVPVLGAGGIGSGRQVAASLALGARGGPELRLVYQQTRFAETETSTGYSLEIDGAFSANAGAISPGCGQGAVIFETTTPIEFDSSNALIAGALNLQLSEDRIVQVRVEQGVFVLESEGASRRYSVGELQQLCS